MPNWRHLESRAGRRRGTAAGGGDNFPKFREGEGKKNAVMAQQLHHWTAGSRPQRGFFRPPLKVSHGMSPDCPTKYPSSPNSPPSTSSNPRKLVLKLAGKGGHRRVFFLAFVDDQSLSREALKLCVFLIGSRIFVAQFLVPWIGT